MGVPNASATWPARCSASNAPEVSPKIFRNWSRVSDPRRYHSETYDCVNRTERSWKGQWGYLAAIVDLCAWVHAEWVRIHPFANGNGRTARLWANSLAMRYGLPPFVRLRSRPNAGYADAGAKAMQGEWKPTAAVFHRLLEAFLKEI